MQTLTPAQISKLDKHEGIITRGQQTFVEVGNSLWSIREEKLYLRDYDTFEAYCQGRWGWSRQRSNQLISAAQLIENLPPTLAAKVINERDARALLPLEPAEQKQAIREASREDVPIAEKAKSFSEKPVPIERNVTTPVVNGSSNGVVEKPKPDIRLDSIGREIPRDMVEEWDRAATVANRLRSCASEIKVTVERGLAEKDLIFGEITNPTIAEAASLHYTLSQIAPYAVCPVCQGRSRKNCQLCRKRGWISKYLYQSPAVSSETKAILEKARK